MPDILFLDPNHWKLPLDFLQTCYRLVLGGKTSGIHQQMHLQHSCNYRGNIYPPYLELSTRLPEPMHAIVLRVLVAISYSHNRRHNPHYIMEMCVAEK